MAGSYAIQDAELISEIGFPEFTAKLISSVFDTLIASNMTQTQMYIELLKQTAKALTEFINDTKDDINGEMILQLLAKILPDKTTGSTGTLVTSTSQEKLTADQVTTIKDNLSVPDATGYETVAVTVDQTMADAYATIIKATAARIAADKYTILKEMVKLGVLRIVVDNGVIETKLNFNTRVSSFYKENSSKYDSKDFNFQSSVKTGGFLSNWIQASASTSYTTLSVSTNDITTGNNTATDIQIMGSVKIVFKSDYQSLNTIALATTPTA